MKSKNQPQGNAGNCTYSAEGSINHIKQSQKNPLVSQVHGLNLTLGEEMPHHELNNKIKMIMVI